MLFKKRNKHSRRDRKYLARAKKNAWAGVTWKEWYYGYYLHSPEWKAKRLAVLQRDRYICQGCLSEKATCVHHTTYKDVQIGNAREMLFDLVSLCEKCHAQIRKNKEVTS